jgi:hypothetical protein
MEGGAKNGVQTAVDDSLAADERFTCLTVPLVFGLAVLYARCAAYAPALEALLSPLHHNPLLQRVEDNRVNLIRGLSSSSSPRSATGWRGRNESST